MCLHGQRFASISAKWTWIEKQFEFDFSLNKVPAAKKEVVTSVQYPPRCKQLKRNVFQNVNKNRLLLELCWIYRSSLVFRWRNGQIDRTKRSIVWTTNSNPILPKKFQFKLLVLRTTLRLRRCENTLMRISTFGFLKVETTAVWRSLTSLNWQQVEAAAWEEDFFLKLCGWVNRKLSSRSKSNRFQETS